MNNIVFLFFGSLIALLFFFFVFRVTDNLLLSFGVFVVTLAFWIGTLTVVFRGRIPF